MKIRTGFVSNSSSSSFVVGFSKVPESAAELQAMLFGDAVTYPNPYPDYCDVNEWPCAEIAQIVWNDLQGKSSLDQAGIMQVITSGYFEGYPEYRESERVSRIRKQAEIVGVKDVFAYPEWERKWRKAFDADCVEERERVDTAALAYFEQVRYLFNGRATFEFEYDDGEPRGSAMEHGNLFCRLPHIQVSKH
jgi:hypothetical protein